MIGNEWGVVGPEWVDPLTTLRSLSREKQVRVLPVGLSRSVVTTGAHPTLCPGRLVAQDLGFSCRGRGFESPSG